MRRRLLPVLLLALTPATALVGCEPMSEFDFGSLTPGLCSGCPVGDRLACFDVRVGETINHVLLVDFPRMDGSSLITGSEGAFVSHQAVYLRSRRRIDYVSAPGAVLLDEIRYDLAAGRVLCLAERDDAPHVTQLALDLERLGNGHLKTTDEADELCRRLLDLPEVAAALERR